MPVVEQTRRARHLRYAHEHGLGVAEWRALGTSVHLLVTAPAMVDLARAAVEDVLERIDLAASRFRDDSELAAVNTARGAWVQISPLLAQALRVALDAAEWTGGLVDPTVGATLVDLGYDRTFTDVMPDSEAPVVSVRRLPGWQVVELDDAARRVRVPAGTIVDLGATAKGLAADLASEAAAYATGCGVLVNLGGDLSVAGDAPAEGWAVTVGDTSSLDIAAGSESEQTVVLRSGGLATSSVSARRWRRGGFELHHLIDPRLGRPNDGKYRTVSTTAVTCTLANAASTAAVILGAEAPAWLEERGIPARLVGNDGSVDYAAEWPRAGASS